MTFDAVTDQLVSLIASPAPQFADQRWAIETAICDTIAVAAAGFAAPVTRAARAAYPGNDHELWSGDKCSDREAAVLIHGTAAHALDFDDVFLDSHAHPSAVLLPALWGSEISPAALIDAFGVGLSTARAIADGLGSGHYGRGWHATATVGTVAAAAAVAFGFNLTPPQIRSALSLAAAQAGGMQANFGTMAKPCQAGFAAAAGVRAARLAAAGVTGPADALDGRGFFHLYGGGVRPDQPVTTEWRPAQLSLKLFPSCFAAARLIGVALAAREAIGDARAIAAVRLLVPSGSVEVLRYKRPTSPDEAKFSGPFNVAVALLDGTPTLQHFTSEAIARADLLDLMERVHITEDVTQESRGRIDSGTVTLEVELRSGATMRFTRSTIPGSGLDTASNSQLEGKWASCFATFAQAFGRPFPLTQFAGLPAVVERLENIQAFSAG